MALCIAAVAHAPDPAGLPASGTCPSRRRSSACRSAFITGFPSRKAETGGHPACTGGEYLSHRAHRSPSRCRWALARLCTWRSTAGAVGWRSLIEVNIANLAGVPSVIYGLLGLGLFVRTVGLGRSVLAGALTLSLLVLPIVIISSREALRTVPHGLREGSVRPRCHTLADGPAESCCPWRVPGIMTGVDPVHLPRHRRDSAAGGGRAR